MQRFARSALVLCSTLLLSLGSQAQMFRSYLASYGNDGNPCTVSQPCRLLPAALNAVLPNGEIWMLDSANFNSGTVNVNKNVIIEAIPGQVGSIVPVGGAPAMTIAPGLMVTVRNVAIVTNANNPGMNGIEMTTGHLTVEDSLFEVWGTDPSAPNASAILISGTGSLSVRNSTFRHGHRGVDASGGAQVDVTTSKFVQMIGAGAAGVFVEARVASTITKVAVTRSEFTKCYVGLWLQGSTSGSTAMASATASSFTQGSYGVASQAGTSGSTTTLSLSGNQITFNGDGIYQGGAGTATVESVGGNLVRGNSNFNVNGTVTAVGGV